MKRLTGGNGDFPCFSFLASSVEYFPRLFFFIASVVIISSSPGRLTLDYPEIFHLHSSAESIRSAAAADRSPAAVLQPLAGNPPGQSFSIQGMRAVRLPFNFASADLDRAVWDIPVRVDLRGVRGIRFQIRASDLSSVSYFTFYFRSGNGWYVAEFSPRDHGQWQEVEILKSRTTIEGTPSGWGDISAFRFSAWRSHRADTSVDLTGFGYLPCDRRVVVARGSHGFSHLAAGERSSVLRYARRAMEFLQDYGLSATLVEESDLDADFLTSSRVVVLPYNPQLPATAIPALLDFTRRGGRLVGFHTMPRGLEAASGLRQTGLVRGREVEGGFARIALPGNLPVGVPAAVDQDSWNIAEYQGVAGEPEPRVLGNWLNREGRNTGHPALLQTQRALWLSHVLVNDDTAQGGRLLFAMVAHFIPELWRETASARLRDLSGQLPYADFNEAYRAIRRKGAGMDGVEQWLHRAAVARRNAFRRLAEEDYYEIMSLMDEAEQFLREAYLRVQPAAADEFRAAWCHSGEGVGNWGWGETIEQLRRSGFNAVIANMAHPGMAWFGSRYLPQAQPVPGNDKDQLLTLVEVARRNNVETHVWIMLFRLGSQRDDDFMARLRRENRLLVNRDGSVDEDWICPIDPRNRALMLAIVREIVDNYHVDGIHLDYVRYPSPDAGFGDWARRFFEREIGHSIADWPDALSRDARLAERWRRFRVEQINSFVRDARRVVEDTRPGVKLSAAVFRNEASAVDSIGQDWLYWVEQGWLDFVAPMNYTGSLESFTHALRRQTEAGKRFGIPVYPGIGLTTDRLGSIGVIDQITAARALGVDGFVIFEINPATAETVFPDLGKGVTRVNILRKNGVR